MGDILHREALAALLDEATRPQRWGSRAELARDCGFAPATFTHAINGSRGLSKGALAALTEQTGWTEDVLHVPSLARPGDLETRRLLTALERLRTSVVSELDQLHRDITSRNGG